MGATNQVNPQSAVPLKDAKQEVEVTVRYLPAKNEFRRDFSRAATVGQVRADAMAFFGVSDHQDRDTHVFYLEFEHRRLANMNETLQQLIGEHRDDASFFLVEEIKPGGVR